jgi:hypothetical protein
MKDTKAALKWIVKILKKRKINFEIRGGFAAKIYGSKRELADIDVEVKDVKDTETFFRDVKKYIVWGPKRYKDRNWDLLLLTLKYKGQYIDISGLGLIKIFNKKTKKWNKLGFNPSTSVKKEIYGIKIPVIPLQNLINYKKKLSRRVDLSDVKQILN